MRRAVLAGISTIVGLVLLLSFKSHGGRPGRLATLGATTAPAAAPPVSTPRPAPTGAAPTRAPVSRTITGQAVDTQYGPVQVQVLLVGTRIVRITPLQLPSGQSRDDQINSYAIPILSQEALQAQSARIDTVSGASFTSDGYAQSLQSALDQVRS